MHHVRCPGECGRDLFRVSDRACPTCWRNLCDIVNPLDDPGAATLVELFARSSVACPECAYNLHGLMAEICPECGLKLEFRHIFGEPACPRPRPTPALSEASSIAWACTPALMAHAMGALMAAAAARTPVVSAASMFPTTLAALDLAAIVAVFVLQERYARLELEVRQGLAGICWCWAGVSWLMLCGGMYPR